jgi:hypothetical protein
MNYRTVLSFSFLVTFAWASAAQEPSGHIDLDVLAGDQLVVGRVVFSGAGDTCPQQFGALRLHSDGSITELQALFANSLKRYTEARTAPLDDETHRHQVATETCRVDIDIREQVRGAGVWTSLLLPRSIRPSLSPEERSEAKRARDDRSTRNPPERSRRPTDGRRSEGSLRQGGVVNISGGLSFDGVRTCFEAVGEYFIDSRGVALQFVTSLPGELNRFMMERIDVDDDHSRLYLARGDCRIELTIGASILSQGNWVARSIAPFLPPTITVRCPACRDRLIDPK